MKYLWALCIFLFTLLGVDEVRAESGLIGYVLNREVRYEKNSTEEFVDRNPQNFQLRYLGDRYSFAIEYLSFSDKTGNATSSVKREHQELQIWAMYNWYLFTSNKSVLLVNAGVGAGALKETINTKLNSDSRVDEGKEQFLSGLSLGAQYSYFISKHWGASSAVDGRALFSSSYYPNPAWDLTFRFGVHYSF